jgi:hypothetical protein
MKVEGSQQQRTYKTWYTMVGAHSRLEEVEELEEKAEEIRFGRKREEQKGRMHLLELVSTIHHQ